MTLTYGFYNSVDDDRLYDAIQVSSIFDGIIEDGVYASIGDKFMVSESSGLQVSIGTGRAWFKHTWSKNDSAVLLTADAADVLLHRIDIVALEINSDVAVRANSLKIIKGTPSSNPVAPTLTKTATVNQYPLAHLYIAANATTITQANITNKVGTTDCPFVTGPLSVVTTNEILAQWEAEFMEWFDEMKDQLSVDAAGNLQLQINAIVGDLNPPLITLLALKTHNHDSGGSTPTIGPNAIVANAVDSTKVGNGVAQYTGRQGGSPNAWESPGVNSYTPAAIRFETGVYQFTMNSGVANMSQTISYPQSFDNYPALFLSIFEYIGTWQSDINVYATSRQTNGFTLNIKRGVTTAAIGVTISWMAIGPIVDG